MYYFEEIKDNKETWVGDFIHVKNEPKPSFHIQVSQNSRIKCVSNNKPIFWSTTSKDFYEHFFLKSYEKFDLEDLPIKPIRADKIRELSNTSLESYFKSWGRFFVKSLFKNNGNFLYNGLWLLKHFIPKTKDSFEYKLLHEHKKIFLDIYNVKESIFREQFDILDWGHYDLLGLINIKEIPDKNDGRVKWWRKIIKEGNLPPIFVLYLSGIYANIIIDGHSRLMASILENIVPNIIIISPVKRFSLISSNQQNESINQVNKRFENNKMTLDKYNNFLINMYESLDYYQTDLFRAYFNSNLEHTWEFEVINNLNTKNKEYIESMIKRESI